MAWQHDVRKLWKALNSLGVTKSGGSSQFNSASCIQKFISLSWRRLSSPTIWVPGLGFVRHRGKVRKAVVTEHPVYHSLAVNSSEWLWEKQMRKLTKDLALLVRSLLHLVFWQHFNLSSESRRAHRQRQTFTRLPQMLLEKAEKTDYLQSNNWQKTTQHHLWKLGNWKIFKVLRK